MRYAYWFGKISWLWVKNLSPSESIGNDEIPTGVNHFMVQQGQISK
jgi:hypothetical protein